jgi:DNA invertase Pin-like site-specific DNA recombinase
MTCGYARASTNGQSVDARVRQLVEAGCQNVFRETASGAGTDRAELRKAIARLDASDALMVTRIDRLARVSDIPLPDANPDNAASRIRSAESGKPDLPLCDRSAPDAQTATST